MKRYLPKGWWDVFRRETKLMTGRSTYVLVFGILPLVAIVVMSLFFGDGVPRDLPIAVVDHDNSSLSRKLTRMIDAAATPKVEYGFVSENEAMQAMQKLDIYGFVVIPPDFGTHILKGESPKVKFIQNNAFMVAAGILNKDVATVVSTFSTGTDYTLRTKKGMSHGAAMAAAMPVMPDSRTLFNPYTNYFYYLTIAFLPLTLLMFILAGTVYVIGSEFKYGRASDWIGTAHGSIFRGLTAKLFPYVLIFMLFIVLIHAIIFGLFNTPLNGSILILAYNAVLFVLSYVSMGIVIIAIFPSLRMALSISAIYAALAFTMSGLTFPHSAMYEPIAYVAKAFPFTHYLKVFIDQSLRGAPVQSSLPELFAMNVFLFLPFLALPRLKKICYSPQWWGKN